MRTRPKALTWMAAYLGVIAMAFPVQVMWMYDHSPFEIAAIAAKLAPMNWIVIALAGWTAWLLLRASTALFVAVPLLAAAIGYNNWLVAYAGLNAPAWAAHLGTLAFAATLAPIFTANSRAALMNPKLRWWMTPRRWKVQMQIRIKFGSKELTTRTFDISESGAFISLEASSDKSRQQLPVGSTFFMSLPLNGLNYLQCRAEVVRNAEPAGQYPAGVGVRFLNLSFEEQRQLATFLRQNSASSASASNSPASPPPMSH